MANILVIAQRVPFPPNKGEKLRTYYQIKHLVEHGHRLTVCAPTESANDVEDANALSRHLGISVITHPLKAKWRRFLRGLISGKSLSEANFYSQALASSVARLSESAELILCTASSLAPYILNLPKPPAAKCLMDFMDVDSDKWLQYCNAAHWPKRLIYKREHHKIKALEIKSVERFERCFVIAQAEHDLFIERVCATEKLGILGNGINQAEFAASHIPSDKFHILFTGVMDYKPNIDAVLWFIHNCWDKVKQSCPNAVFTIAGMNPDTKVQALAKDADIQVTGFVEDIMPYFNRAHLFIAPFQIARGVQNKVLQAMNCSLAVVSTSLGAEGISVKDAHNISINDDAESFASACIELAKDTTLRHKLGQNAHATIKEHYSWESVLTPLLREAETEKIA